MYVDKEIFTWILDPFLSYMPIQTSKKYKTA